MCPPPSEPIRPIGPVGGDVYVERARFAERVERRRPRQEADDDRRGDHGRPEDEQPDDAAERWFGGESPLSEAGGYDDQGRAEHAAAATKRNQPHVDRTA